MDSLKDMECYIEALHNVLAICEAILGKCTVKCSRFLKEQLRSGIKILLPVQTFLMQHGVIDYIWPKLGCGRKQQGPFILGNKKKNMLE